MPLLVALHGCNQTASDFSSSTRFNALAADQGFIVAYPQQSTMANSLSCWNWFDSFDWTRDSGEAGIIAGIVDEVRGKWTVDSKRIYATGLSAGGAMAIVMGTAYPDVFAAVGSAEGCPFQGLPCVNSASTSSATSLAQAVRDQMGSRARLVPLFVVQGQGDTYVPPANAELIIKQWIGAADLIDDSKANSSVSSLPTSSQSLTTPGGYSYEVKKYDAASSNFIEYWLVSTLSHAWSGGSDTVSFSDPKGPDASKGVWSFFSSHPMP
jgi:poly(hydroxyalkanoate) depolymerase family esterase